MTLPFEISVISTSSGEKMTFFGDPVWVIWYTDKRLEARPGTYNTLLKLPWLISILPFHILSVRELSPKNIGGTFDMSREEKISFVETICLEAPESMMKLGELEVPTTKACTLSLSSEFDPPYLLFEQSGREMLFLSTIWTCLSCFSYKISEYDSPYCSISTCSFLLCSSSSGDCSWSLRTPL